MQTSGIQSAHNHHMTNENPITDSLIPLDERIALLHDSIGVNETGILRDISLDNTDGSVTGKWALNQDALSLVIVEFERQPLYTMDSFLSRVEEDHEVSCGILVSISHRIQGVQGCKKISITRTQGGKVVMCVSRGMYDSISPEALVQYGLTTLQQVSTLLPH